MDRLESQDVHACVALEIEQLLPLVLHLQEKKLDAADDAAMEMGKLLL